MSPCPHVQNTIMNFDHRRFQPTFAIKSQATNPFHSTDPLVIALSINYAQYLGVLERHQKKGSSSLEKHDVQCKVKII